MTENVICDIKKGETDNLQNENAEQEYPIRMNVGINHGKNGKGFNDNVNILLLVCIIGVTIGIVLEIINVQARNRSDGKKYTHNYIVWSKDKNVDDKDGILKHIHLVLERIGREKVSNGSSWELLWSHDYPFFTLYPSLSHLKPHQKVNHIPGIGYITNKVDLATTDSKYIPKAFKLPKNKDGFLKYVSENKHAVFLEKHNQHRGVLLKNVSEINFDGQSFVQKFMMKPFLVDGYKFDIGVYVVVTSVKPLRLYWFKGEVLFSIQTTPAFPLIEDYFKVNPTPLISALFQDIKKGEKENLPNKNTEQENTIRINVGINHDKNGKGSNDNVNMRLFVFVIGVIIGIALLIYVLAKFKSDEKKYIVWAAEKNVNDKNGIFKHLHLVLERIGYEKISNGTSWRLLWTQGYPFLNLYNTLEHLKPYQKVNHVPGLDHITYKVNQATTNSKYIPKAFKLPKNRVEFLKYASEHRNAMFVEKNNDHRGVYLKNVSEINFNGQSFVQKYVEKPFLVDGHKFDIGVYVVVTSVNPLRLYRYKGEVGFRFCPAKYYPLNVTNLDQYVIGDDYLPTWKVPSLRQAYCDLGFSMKDSFDMYATAQGKNVSKMWEDVHKAIVEIFLIKIPYIRESVENYASQYNFFEMLRVDLIVDEDFNVHLLEANMSPNLSSGHFPPNQLIYEQLLYNLFSITGISNEVLERGPTTKDMVSSQKNIAVFGKECKSCNNSCADDICRLSKHCIDASLRDSLLRAHKEFLHRGDFRRLFPPSMTQGSMPDKEILKDLSDYDRLQYLWYQGKCNVDITWCT